MKLKLTILYLLCLAPIFVGGASCSTELGSMHEAISGKNLRAIQAAMPEFMRTGMDISRYRIVVDENESHVVVTFIDADAPDDPRGRIRGNLSKLPAFIVELGRNDLQVIRSNFMR
ncbi:hypothetical protein JQ612_16235 [Bradyrhizobium manausense]|uniref:hypothetical protein n=1 Tax=Bradyrhizobium manausense TaxID=989370 RepID=UPI001BA47C52|nr:hypothetical protein [Bradyrhizobium manausense]MBR0834739.1 hypothetical protein [Bradyrhizobium manausense]